MSSFGDKQQPHQANLHSVNSRSSANSKTNSDANSTRNNVNNKYNVSIQDTQISSVDARRPTGNAKSSAQQPSPTPFMTQQMLGVQWNSEKDMKLYKRISTLGGHQFQVVPISHFHSRSAQSKFVQLVGDMNPVFEAERFDNVRRYLQNVDKREKNVLLQSIAMLYVQKLSSHLVHDEAQKIDCVQFQKCFYPNYAPRYADALRAVNLPKPLWWRHHDFSGLQDISRLPLDQCDKNKTAKMSFQQYFNLLWNYYQPFNAIAYLCYVLAQSILFTRQLVDSVTDYLVYRHSLITDIKARKAPILFLGSKIGKFGAFINATRRLPVPVIHAHEKPQNNPYLLFIPPHKQNEFKPTPIVKMKAQLALEKYEPSIVLLSDMDANTDITSIVRKQGSVRQYIYFGLANSYVEGNPWNTWGVLKYSQDRSDRIPPYMRDGFRRITLPHLSRWMLHKLDNSLQMGNGVVTSWMRAPLYPSALTRNCFRLKRFRPFF